MKAIVRTSLEPGSMEVQERPMPQITDNEVLIKIKDVGVCGTDLHIYNGNVVTGTDVIIGHELSGEIEKIGSKVKNFKPGDRVVSRLNVGVCGTCKACLSGNPQMCEHRTCPGHWVDGAFAEYMKIDDKQLLKFGENLSFEEAAFTEPMACVATALVERTGVQAEDVVVISGPGPIGLLAAQMAKLYGASKVIMMGTPHDKELRLPLAKKLGVDMILVSGEDDVEKIISDLTNEEGADLFVDCSGAAAAINSGLRMLKRLGRMCVIGLPGQREIPIEWKTAGEKSLDIVFSYSSSPTSWNLCLSMLERGAIDVKSMISQKVGLEDFESVVEATKRGEVIKAIIEP
ncbi:MAG: zinc-binding dehydrogenase [Eubacterium sp.]|nr:zinc-binding dehydrogenase [Eubacterium sp.]